MKKLRIMKDCVRRSMAITDALLHAVVMHTHSIVLRPEVVVEDIAPEPGRIVLAPLTRNHVAELLAQAWPPGHERGSPTFWSWRYRSETGYELFEDVPEELRERALAARAAIAGHALVAELIPE